MKHWPTMRPRDLRVADVQGNTAPFTITVRSNKYDNYDVSSGTPSNTLEDCLYNQIPWAVRWIMESHAHLTWWADNASWIVVEGRRTTKVTITKRHEQYIARIRTAQQDLFIGPSTSRSEIVESALYEIIYATQAAHRINRNHAQDPTRV